MKFIIGLIVGCIMSKSNNNYNDDDLFFFAVIVMILVFIALVINIIWGIKDLKNR